MTVLEDNETEVGDIKNISHLFTFHGTILVTTTLGYRNCQIGYNCGYNRLTHMRVYSRKKEKKIQYSGQTNIVLTCEA